LSINYIVERQKDDLFLAKLALDNDTYTMCLNDQANMNILESNQSPRDQKQEDGPQVQSTWEKIRKYVPLVIFILAAFLFAKSFNVDSFKEFLDQHETIGLVICLFGYPLLGVTVIPTDPLTILVLAWKGPVAAVIMATIGNTLSAMVEFYLGQSLGDLADFEKRKTGLPLHLDRLPVNSPLFLILARMVPGFGAKFTSIAAGIYQIPMFTYLWTTIVANLVGAILLVSGGYGLLKLFQ
jgi:uncharacterized membrane protein YdjX (TVP38/TMEM64 family)